MSEAAVEAPGDETAFAGTYEAPEAEAAEVEAPQEEVEVEAAAEEAQPEAPAVDWRSNPEVQDFIRSEVDAIFQARTAEPTYEPEAEEEPELDLFAEDAGSQLANFIKSQIGEAIQPIVGPLAQAQQEKQAAEAKEALQDLLGAVDVGGDFDKGLASDLFALYRDDAIAKYGTTNRAAEYAAEQAARRARAIEEVAEKRGAERLRNELAAVGGAAREPGAATQGVRAQTFSDGDEMSVAQRWSS